MSIESHHCSNDAGYLITMHIYKEVTDPVTGVTKFMSLANSDQQGPWHGLPVSTPYLTKVLHVLN